MTTTIDSEKPTDELAIIGSDIVLQATNTHLTRVRDIYGNTHNIQAIWGTKVDLSKLSTGQSVVWGDGKTFHFRLTSKNSINPLKQN